MVGVLTVPDMDSKVGLAWFFERTVIYGSYQDVRMVLGSKSKKRILGKHGAFIGVVKGVIPTDPYRVLYECHKHTQAFKERQKIRAFQRKHGISKLEMRNTRTRVRKKSGRFVWKTVERQFKLDEPFRRRRR